MPTTEKQRAEFAEAVDTLGGPFRTSKLVATPRATLVNWMTNGWPYYRQHEIDRLLDLARTAELKTLERLQRKYRAR